MIAHPGLPQTRTCRTTAYGSSSNPNCGLVAKTPDPLNWPPLNWPSLPWGGTVSLNRPCASVCAGGISAAGLRGDSLQRGKPETLMKVPRAAGHKLPRPRRPASRSHRRPCRQGRVVRGGGGSHRSSRARGDNNRRAKGGRMPAAGNAEHDRALRGFSGLRSIARL